MQLIERHSGSQRFSHLLNDLMVMNLLQTPQQISEVRNQNKTDCYHVKVVTVSSNTITCCHGQFQHFISQHILHTAMALIATFSMSHCGPFPLPLPFIFCVCDMLWAWLHFTCYSGSNCSILLRIVSLSLVFLFFELVAAAKPVSLPHSNQCCFSQIKKRKKL